MQWSTTYIPLGIEVVQLSHTWSAEGFDDIIIVFYTVRNISETPLYDLYLGLFVDGDVGHVSEPGNRRAQDDLTGFLHEDEGEIVDLAYIIDNDGCPWNVTSGNQFSAPQK